MKTTFQISRAKWLNAGTIANGHDSVLLDPALTQHNMCCLGQVLEQCGVARAALAGYDTPAATHSSHILDEDGGPDSWIRMAAPFLFQPLDDRYEHSTLTREAMVLNDSRRDGDPPAIREQALTDLFASHGLTLTFVD